MGEILRRALAAGGILGLLLAGCSSGAGQSVPTPTSSAPSTPQRAAPAKSLKVSNQCSIIQESQWRAIGADQAPYTRSSNGVPGCEYQLGEAGGNGWSVFVGTDTSTTMAQFAAQRPGAQDSSVSGYPVATAKINSESCILAADVADQGSLLVNVLTPTGQPDGCGLATKFAQAAIQNLPNA